MSASTGFEKMFFTRVTKTAPMPSGAAVTSSGGSASVMSMGKMKLVATAMKAARNVEMM